MGLHAQGRSLSDLSREFGIPRQVLSRWWQRVTIDGLAGLAPRSRRPHRTAAISQRTIRRGELLHVDIELLPALRNARYDYEFAAVDDFSREAVVAITTEQTSAAATTFLEQVVGRLPYPVEAVLMDNALAFTMTRA
jgi:transposase-like protein